jgi:hypothetical protein
VRAVFGWKNRREGSHLEYLGLDRRIILKWIFKELDWAMDWNNVAQDSDTCRAVVNAVMNFSVS